MENTCFQNVIDKTVKKEFVDAFLRFRRAENTCAAPPLNSCRTFYILWAQNKQETDEVKKLISKRLMVHLKL